MIFYVGTIPFDVAYVELCAVRVLMCFKTGAKVLHLPLQILERGHQAVAWRALGVHDFALSVKDNVFLHTIVSTIRQRRTWS